MATSDGDDRRERERYRIWFPVKLNADSGAHGSAVTYDASDKGVLLLAPFGLPAGARVEVTMLVGKETQVERVTKGAVTRSGPNEDDPLGLWRFRLAIEFDAPVPGLEDELVALSAEHPLLRPERQAPA